MKTTHSPNIRRDVYSVKVIGNGFNEWCHERMFRSIESARKYRAGLQAYGGYSLSSKIVHPAQWAVDGYLAAGNRIEL